MTEHSEERIKQVEDEQKYWRKVSSILCTGQLYGWNDKNSASIFFDKYNCSKYEIKGFIADVLISQSDEIKKQDDMLKEIACENIDANMKIIRLEEIIKKCEEKINTTHGK